MATAAVLSICAVLLASAQRVRTEGASSTVLSRHRIARCTDFSAMAVDPAPMSKVLLTASSSVVSWLQVVEWRIAVGSTVSSDVLDRELPSKETPFAEVLIAMHGVLSILHTMRPAGRWVHVEGQRSPQGPKRDLVDVRIYPGGVAYFPPTMPNYTLTPMAEAMDSTNHTRTTGFFSLRPAKFGPLEDACVVFWSLRYALRPAVLVRSHLPETTGLRPMDRVELRPRAVRFKATKVGRKTLRTIVEGFTALLARFRLFGAVLGESAELPVYGEKSGDTLIIVLFGGLRLGPGSWRPINASDILFVPMGSAHNLTGACCEDIGGTGLVAMELQPWMHHR